MQKRTIKYSRTYIKSARKVIEGNNKLRNRLEARVHLFIGDSTNPILRDHSLSGNLYGLRAFRITGDIRIVYLISDAGIEFLDIGTHSQVYRGCFFQIFNKIYTLIP
jgi:addiction module RelE/StbE family toxin